MKSALLSCLLLAPLAAAAGPVAEEDRAPLDLRRTTLVVGDIDRSLAFYRDALGMVVIYDRHILTPHDAAGIEQAERASRLVFLRANDDYIGILGLLQYIKPRKDRVDLTGRALDEGTTVLVINHSDARAAFERARAVDGVSVLWEPEETTYPSYDGQARLRVLVSGLQDPDGFAVEVNQLLDELR